MDHTVSKRISWKKRLLRIIILFVLCLSLLLIFLMNPVFFVAGKSDLPSFSAQRLRDHVTFLTQIEGSRTCFNQQGLATSKAYIQAQLESVGLSVMRQPYADGWLHFENLITSFGPADAPRVILGAHYDVCDEQPGADDNASSVAALLEIARTLAQEKPTLNYRLDLAFYCTEEPPYFRTPNMGSAQHAKALKAQGAKILVMIALDCIGYFSDVPSSQNYPIIFLRLVFPSKGNFIAVAGHLGNYRLVRKVKAHMKAARSIPVWSLNAPQTLPGIDFGDHLNFWAEGYPAVLVSDTAFYRNANYHETSDTADTLDYERLAGVTQALYGTILFW